MSASGHGDKILIFTVLTKEGQNVNCSVMLVGYTVGGANARVMLGASKVLLLLVVAHNKLCQSNNQSSLNVLFDILWRNCSLNAGQNFESSSFRVGAESKTLFF